MLDIWCPTHDSLPDCIRIPNEDGTEDVFYSVAYQGIPAEFKTVAENELNETDENKKKGIRKLKEFIKKEKLSDVSDNILIMVLRVCKYNGKKAENKLKKFLRTREMIISRLEHLDIETVERIIDDGGIGMLPYRDRHGRTIVYTRPEAMDEEAYTMEDMLLVGLAYALVIFAYPLTNVVGVSYIGDGKFKSTSQYFKILKAYSQHIWTFLDLPIRVGRVDVIRQHILARGLFNILRPFLSSKIINRISFYGDDLCALSNIYHPDILPDEFGGNMGPANLSLFKSIGLDVIKKLKAECQALKEAKEKKPK